MDNIFMNSVLVSIEISLKAMEILKRNSIKNKLNKNQLASKVINAWDGDVKLFKEVHRHKLGEFLPDYEDIRNKGVQLNINISEKANRLLIDILNQEDNRYTKLGMVRDILFAFIIFGNKNLVNKLKKSNIILEDCTEILKNESLDKEDQDNKLKYNKNIYLTYNLEEDKNHNKKAEEILREWQENRDRLNKLNYNYKNSF